MMIEPATDFHYPSLLTEVKTTTAYLNPVAVLMASEKVEFERVPKPLTRLIDREDRMYFDFHPSKNGETTREGNRVSQEEVSSLLALHSLGSYDSGNDMMHLQSLVQKMRLVALRSQSKERKKEMMKKKKVLKSELMPYCQYLRGGKNDDDDANKMKRRSYSSLTSSGF